MHVYGGKRHGAAARPVCTRRRLRPGTRSSTQDYAHPLPPHCVLSESKLQITGRRTGSETGGVIASDEVHSLLYLTGDRICAARTDAPRNNTTPCHVSHAGAEGMAALPHAMISMLICWRVDSTEQQEGKLKARTLLPRHGNHRSNCRSGYENKAEHGNCARFAPRVPTGFHLA